MLKRLHFWCNHTLLHFQRKAISFAAHSFHSYEVGSFYLSGIPRNISVKCADWKSWSSLYKFHLNASPSVWLSFQQERSEWPEYNCSCTVSSCLLSYVSEQKNYVSATSLVPGNKCTFIYLPVVTYDKYAVSPLNIPHTDTCLKLKRSLNVISWDQLD